jgi:hypothetical protein
MAMNYDSDGCRNPSHIGDAGALKQKTKLVFLQNNALSLGAVWPL